MTSRSDPTVREWRDPCFACGHADRVTAPDDHCGGCGASRVMPPPERWPREVKRYLVNALLARVFAPYGGDSARGWLHLAQWMFERTTVDVPRKGRWLIRQGTPLGHLWPLLCQRAGVSAGPLPSTPDADPRP